MLTCFQAFRRESVVGWPRSGTGTKSVIIRNISLLFEIIVQKISPFRIGECSVGSNTILIWKNRILWGFRHQRLESFPPVFKWQIDGSQCVSECWKVVVGFNLTDCWHNFATLDVWNVPIGRLTEFIYLSYTHVCEFVRVSWWWLLSMVDLGLTFIILPRIFRCARTVCVYKIVIFHIRGNDNVLFQRVIHDSGIQEMVTIWNRSTTLKYMRWSLFETKIKSTTNWITNSQFSKMREICFDLLEIELFCNRYNFTIWSRIGNIVVEVTSDNIS